MFVSVPFCSCIDRDVTFLQTEDTLELLQKYSFAILDLSPPSEEKKGGNSLSNSHLLLHGWFSTVWRSYHTIESPLFCQDRRDQVLSVTGGRLGFICTERACVGVYSGGGRGGRRFFPTRHPGCYKDWYPETKMAARFSRRLISTILRWRYTGRFATTIFSATHRCNIGPML